jgi:hypothetical protein
MKTLRIMTQRNILYVLIAFTVIVVVLGIVVSQDNITASRPGSAGPVTAAGPLFSPQPFYDFGNVSMAAGKVSHKFRIRNAGETATTITKLYTSCMCTEATLITPAGRKGPFGMPGHGTMPSISERLAPGAEAQVEIVFDPAAHGPAGIGLTERIISIKSGPDQPLELRFSAMVRP